MAAYFSIPHLGSGTTEVEGLSSYLARLSWAHGCSDWQLVRHLSAWWDETKSDDTHIRVPKILSSETRMPLCGVGNDVAILVAILISATGIRTLRSGTILALQPAISSTSIGAIRRFRAWCPACYEEDVRDGRELYDRLLWALQPITRCATHKTALIDRCPSCGNAQNYSPGLRFDRCRTCAANLVPNARQWKIVDRPPFGEKLLYELVSSSAQNPDIIINRESMRLFFKRIRKEIPPGDPLLSLRSFTSSSARPSLSSVLRLATTFDVSLLDFQTTEPPITSRGLYGATSVQLPIKKHGRLSKDTQEKVALALKAALASPDLPLPFGQLCSRLKVSTGYIFYQFPSLSRAYAQLRKARVGTIQNSMMATAQKAIDSGLMDDYLHGRIKQLKDLVRAVASVSGVSTVMARKAIALYQASRTTDHQMDRSSR